MTLLVDVNHPGSQEDVLYNRQPAHSLVKHELSGTESAMASSLLALAVAHLPFCLQGETALNGSQLLLLLYSLGHNPLFYEHTRSHCEASEPFMGKLCFFVCLFVFMSLQPSHSLGCYVTLALSDCSQDIQAQSLL